MRWNSLPVTKCVGHQIGHGTSAGTLNGIVGYARGNCGQQRHYEQALHTRQRQFLDVCIGPAQVQLRCFHFCLTETL